jgi:hypothetical protein
MVFVAGGPRRSHSLGTVLEPGLMAKKLLAVCRLPYGCAARAARAGPLPPGALMARAVPPERLKMFSPEAIHNALTNGKMQTQGAALSEPERRVVSEFASGQTFSGAKEALANSFCKNPQPKTPFTASPHWLSWGNGVESSRFQPKEQGKLTAPTCHA